MKRVFSRVIEFGCKVSSSRLPDNELRVCARRILIATRKSLYRSGLARVAQYPPGGGEVNVEAGYGQIDREA
jgi:hypothetical protein